MRKLLRILLAAAFWAHTADLLCLAELGHDDCHPHEEAGHQDGGRDAESPLACTAACALNHVAVVRAEAPAPAPSLSLGDLRLPAETRLSPPPAKDIFHPPA